MIYEDNPLRVEMVPTLVPVAREVRIDVAGEPVIDPKRDSVQSNESNEINETRKTKCQNALELSYFVFLILLLIGFIGAFILFLVWMDSPNLFGKDPNAY
jgi:nitrate reductase NapE component